MGFTSGGYIMQRGLGRAQFRKLETVASRLSNCDHFYGNRFFQPSGLSPNCLSYDQNPIARVSSTVATSSQGNPLRRTVSTTSAKRSISWTDVNTLGATRIPGGPSY